VAHLFSKFPFLRKFLQDTSTAEISRSSISEIFYYLKEEEEKTVHVWHLHVAR
jgi:hypothetical protein